MARKSPEFKKMMGDRQSLSDGFTYSYGKFNDYKSRNRKKNSVHKSRRADKRSVKQKENKRMSEEE